jgi:hypothetical protein
MWSLKLKTTLQLSCNLSDIGAGRVIAQKMSNILLLGKSKFHRGI